MQSAMHQQRTAKPMGKARATLNVGSFFDIEESLQASLKGFGTIESPGVALVMGLMFALFSLVCLGLTITFDVLPTVQFSMSKAGYLVPAHFTGFVGLLGFLLTLAPSLTEMLAPSLLKRGVKVAFVPMACAIVFDAISDLPSVTAFIDTLKPLFDGYFGAMSGVVYQVALWLWLLAATLGWEMLFVISLTSAAQLLWLSQHRQREQRGWR